MSVCRSCGKKIENNSELCESCAQILRDFEDRRVLSRFFLQLQRLKQGLDARSKLPASSSIGALLRQSTKVVGHEISDLKESVEGLVEGQLASLLKWARLAGVGPVGLLLFIGEINPTFPNAGPIHAYFALTPEGKRVSGQRVKGNLALKGKMFMLARSVVMHRVPYYYELFLAKKRYYRDVKGLKPAVAHGKALFWLAKLLVSHAHELIRRSLGLPISHLGHENYVPPRVAHRGFEHSILMKVIPVLKDGRLMKPEELYGERWGTLKEALNREYGHVEEWPLKAQKRK